MFPEPNSGELQAYAAFGSNAAPPKTSGGTRYVDEIRDKAEAERIRRRLKSGRRIITHRGAGIIV
ncbi:hypothetical protein Brsp01_43580 [Brucella sp. NBRC 12950]|nr:hypothetical protein Brsp01_43580 [Brucella sp. NBRC 12950]